MTRMVNDDDIGKCLTSLGIEKRQIIPTNVLRQQQPELNQFRNEINIFPLEWFDSGDGNDLKLFMGCREGLAFLPLHQSTSVEINSDDFEWQRVTVEKHNEKANKWRIKELKSGAIYEVPRIYLMLIVEKPLKFAQRIYYAQQLRNECEMRLKFEAVVDKIVLSEIPKPPQRFGDNIGKLLFLSSNNTRWKEFFEWEYRLQYQKTLAALDLIKFFETNPHESIQLPTMAPRKAKLENLSGNNEKVKKKQFEESRRDFQQMWLYSCPQAIKIMEFINNECEDVSRMSLFHIQTTNSEDLNCFVNGNDEKLSEISDFLRQKWIEDVLVRAVKCRLAENGKGHFDLTVNDSYIYRKSKLNRLIGLIKQRMQIALRLMLRSSLRAFVNHLCQPCESMLENIAVNFVWGNDLVTSRFHSPQPVFTLILDFNDDGNEPSSLPVFTTNVERFEFEIIEMFKSRVLTTHETPQIDPYLVTKLEFEKGLKLSSIGLLDKEIQNQICHLQRCYRVALVPIRAYAQEFRKFGELKNLIVPEYVQSWRESDKTAKEMREEISHQLECIDEIERSVPSTIVIGPFRISVEAMKTSLIVKRKKIHDSLLEMFIEKVKEKLMAANNELKDIFLKLTQNFENVEKLVEVREWIPTIDDEIEQIKSKMLDAEIDIEALETMFTALSDEDLEIKYFSLQMPERIAQTVIGIQSKHNFEFEQFRKLQNANEVQFHQKVEALTGDVRACSAKHEFENLSGTTTECEKLWSALHETLTHGEVLNNRQKIFNQPEIDMERLNVLVKRLHPYHTLWTMASNFLQSKENWSKSPLSSVDVEIVDAEMKRCENVLRDSRLHFTADAEMMVSIEKISAVIDAGSKMFDVLRDLMNPDFQEQHWKTLSNRTGTRYKYSTTVTFESLIARGVIINAEVVKEVLMEATSEREAKESEEIEAENKRREAEDIKKKKKARLAARNDI